MSSLLPVCTTTRVLAAGSLLTLVIACGAGAVEVPVPSPGAAAVRQCRTLRDRLPGKLHDLSRRTTSPASDLVTAWGSPAIALRCGVTPPAALHPTSELAVINGISWLPVPPDRPVTFTAVGREAYVEVTVPEKYAPPGDVLIELAGPIKASIPANSDGSL